jgi:hypothetical protein
VGRPEQSDEHVAFSYDSDYGYAVNIMKNLYLGPGEPGPGDEWRMPAGPVEEVASIAEDTPEPDRSGRPGLLHRLRRLGHS